MTNQRKGVAGDLAVGRHTGRVGSEADPIRPTPHIDLEALATPTDSESIDAPYNPDIWELRARINQLIGAVARVYAVCSDPGGPDSWSHTFQGRAAVFVDDVLAALEEQP